MGFCLENFGILEFNSQLNDGVGAVTQDLEVQSSELPLHLSSSPVARVLTPITAVSEWQHSRRVIMNEGMVTQNETEDVGRVAHVATGNQAVIGAGLTTLVPARDSSIPGHGSSACDPDNPRYRGDTPDPGSFPTPLAHLPHKPITVAVPPTPGTLGVVEVPDNLVSLEVMPVTATAVLEA
ncbi:hypothetical protein CB1_001749013 [Camelus ferus]|nr:hypothetical protein CB1_001749013 [Camelus ferus]